MKMFGLALKQCAANPIRTLFTILGMMFSTIMLVQLLMYLYYGNVIMEDIFFKNMSEYRIVFSDLWINSTDMMMVNDGYVESPIGIEQGLIDALQNNAEVENLSVLYSLPYDVPCTIDDWNVIYHEPAGVDPQFSLFSAGLLKLLHDTEQDFTAIKAGRLFAPEDTEAAMVSDGVALMLGFTPESIIGETISFQSREKIWDARIIGVYDYRLGATTDSWSFQKMEPGQQIDIFGKNILFSTDILQWLYREQSGDSGRLSPSNVIVTVKNNEKIPDIMDWVSLNYGNPSIGDYIVYKDLHLQQEANTRLFGVLGSIICLVSLLAVLNTMLINIAEQKNFVNVLRILGYERRKITLLYLAQSGLYGLGGSIAGSLIGYLITLVTGLTLKQHYLNMGIEASVKFTLPIVYVLAVVLVTTLVCFVIALVPALMALRIEKKSYTPTNY